MRLEGQGVSLTWKLGEDKRATAAIRLPDGTEKVIKDLKVASKKEAGNIFSKIASSVEKLLKERAGYVYFKEAGRQYCVKQKDLQTQAFHTLFNKAVNKPKGQGLTEKEKTILEKKALGWITASAKNATMGSSQTFFHENHTFHIIQQGQEIDIGVERGELGKGGFKKVDEILLLNADKSEAKISIREDRSPTEMKHELETAEKLKGVPNTMEMRKIVDAKTGQTGALAELCDQGNLYEIFQQSEIGDTETSDKEKLSLLLGAATGLAGMHKLGLVHLDVKPENIFVKTETPPPQGPKTSVEESDLVLRLDEHDKPLNESKETTTPGRKALVGDYGTALNNGEQITGIRGTLLYLAPEMISCSEKTPVSVSEKMDVFAFGCVLYDAISTKSLCELQGQLVAQMFPQDDFENLMNQRLPGDSSYMQLIKKCIAWNPDDRPSMEEVKEALSKIETLPPRIPG